MKPPRPAPEVRQSTACGVYTAGVGRAIFLALFLNAAPQTWAGD